MLHIDIPDRDKVRFMVVQRKTAVAEVKHYDEDSGYPTGARSYKYKDVSIENVLDLTDPDVRCKIGVSLDDITSSDIGAYDKTHQIAKYAEEAGFSAILAPSARDTSGTNLVVFGGF